MNKVEQASQYIDLIRVKSNEALLFLSLGKDSLVLLDLVYPKFDRIVACSCISSRIWNILTVG